MYQTGVALAAEQVSFRQILLVGCASVDEAGSPHTPTGCSFHFFPIHGPLWCHLHCSGMLCIPHDSPGGLAGQGMSPQLRPGERLGRSSHKVTQSRNQWHLNKFPDFLPQCCSHLPIIPRCSALSRIISESIALTQTLSEGPSKYPIFLGKAQLCSSGDRFRT